MNGSKLSYEQIRSNASQLKSSASSMQDILNEVNNLFNKIGSDAVWSGTAASETKAEFDKLSAKFPDFYQAVNDCYTYLEAVVENFKKVDSAITGK